MDIYPWALSTGRVTDLPISPGALGFLHAILQFIKCGPSLACKSCIRGMGVSGDYQYLGRHPGRHITDVSYSQHHSALRSPHHTALRSQAHQAAIMIHNTACC